MQLSKKALAWKVEREAWFAAHPQDVYFCHYCERGMDRQNTTLDHENNRNHDGRLLPCCWMDNSRKGSVSHDSYVQKFYSDHVCNKKEEVTK